MANPHIVAGVIDENNDGAPFDDLALKVYSGMILESFNKTITTKGRHIERMLKSGKSAQFPIVGRVGSDFHTRGTELVMEQVNSTEKVISIQDLLVSPIWVDSLDEAKSHWDVRRPLATQQGQELAEQDDLRVFMCFIAASRSASLVSGGDAGVQIVAATAGTDAAVLKASIYDAAENLDNASVPGADRTLWLAPSQFYLMLQDGEFLDRDFGGDGSRATAIMRNAADFTVVKTTNLPTANEVGDTDFPAELRLDYTTTVAVAGHSSAAASVSLIGLQFEHEPSVLRQGTLLLAKMAKGYGFLRPEAAVEIATA